MLMKLSAIASALDARLENSSSDIEIKGLNGIEEAGPGELTFVSNPKYAQAARTTRASAVIVGGGLPCYHGGDAAGEGSVPVVCAGNGAISSGSAICAGCASHGGCGFERADWSGCAYWSLRGDWGGCGDLATMRCCWRMW